MCFAGVRWSIAFNHHIGKVVPARDAFIYRCTLDVLRQEPADERIACT
jgi:hypothetical protein